MTRSPTLLRSRAADRDNRDQARRAEEHRTVLCVLLARTDASAFLRRALDYVGADPGEIDVITTVRPAWSWDTPLAAMAGLPVHDPVDAVSAEIRSICSSDHRLMRVSLVEVDRVLPAVDLELRRRSYSLALIDGAKRTGAGMLSRLVYERARRLGTRAELFVAR